MTLLIKDWVAIAAGLSGVALGIYNFLRARSESNSRKAQEKRDWDFYVSVVNSNGGHSAQIFHTPKLGSVEHEIFERLAARGLVARSVLGRSVMFTIQ